MSGISNGDGFVGVILFRARQSTKWRCSRQILLIRFTIDRELGWAEEIGMNCMRVYLHHLIWETDKEGFRHNLCRPEFGI